MFEPVHPHVVILGSGFTGNVLARLMVRKGWIVTFTRRPGSARDQSGPPFVEFDLNERATWDNLPALSAFVWLFPAQPLDAVREFWAAKGKSSESCVVVGTTSSYMNQRQDEFVDEKTPLDMSAARVGGEEFLRAQGTVILRSAGIYGKSPGLGMRNPLDWLRNGHIPDGAKLVNLIHVEDLAESIAAAVTSGAAGEQFIVSDGAQRRWHDIAAWGEQNGFLAPIRFRGGEGAPSKRLSNAKLLRQIRPDLGHTDLYAELAILEQHQESIDTSPAP